MAETIHAGTRALLSALFEEACRAVSPAMVMPSSVPIAEHGRTVVIAIGKAAAEMMRVARLRADRPLEGLVITRYGHLPKPEMDWGGVELIEAGHPVPDANSVRAARRALALASELEAGDQLLVLLSGGGSALAAAPVADVTLEDKQRITRQLLRCGAAVDEINGVRKHLSAIKGGRLAVAAGGAKIINWIISDIAGNDPALVASGPTMPNRTSLETARATLSRHGIAAPANVTRALGDPRNETPPPDSPGLCGAETRILATAETALAAATALAAKHKFEVANLGDHLQGESRRLGEGQARIALARAKDGKRTILVSGGETTVTVMNPAGRGGPNLEFLLGLAIALDGAPGISAIAGDTDGIDGLSEAAGALVFPDTLERARGLGLDAAEHLATNRSHGFFEALGDLVVTGPTLTNVNDFRAILIDSGAARTP